MTGGVVDVEEVNDEDVFVSLALRYLDGSTGAVEVAELNDLLLASQGRRVWFLEVAKQATVMSDYHRVEDAATAMVEGSMAESAAEVPEWDRDSWECVSEERRAHSDRRRTLSVAAVAGAAAIVAFTGLMLWWAAEPPPIAEAVPIVSVPTVPMPMVSLVTVAGEGSPLPIEIVGSSEAATVALAAKMNMGSELPLTSPWGDASVPPVPFVQRRAPLLLHSNALTFWSLCRLAAKSDAQQTISSILMEMVQLEFSFEPYTFSRSENLYDWIHPGLFLPHRMSGEL